MDLMKRFILGLGILVSVCFVVYGLCFAGPFLVSDAYLPADAVTNFKVSMDGGAYIDSVPVSNSLKYDLSAITVGVHTIKAQACNIWGCSADSSPLAFTRPVSLLPPVTLRLSP